MLRRLQELGERLRESWAEWLENQFRADVAEEIARAIEQEACGPGQHCTSPYCAQARSDAALARAAARGPLAAEDIAAAKICIRSSSAASEEPVPG